MFAKMIVTFDLSFCSVRSATTQLFIYHSNFIALDNETVITSPSVIALIPHRDREKIHVLIYSSRKVRLL